MTKEDEILKRINENHLSITTQLKTVIEDLRGNGGFNEGLIPAFKRHSNEDTERESLTRNEIIEIKESINRIAPKKPKEGIFGWFEKHEKTIQLIILVYLLIFHPLIINQFFK